MRSAAPHPQPNTCTCPHCAPCPLPPPSLQVGADGKEILLQPPSGDELPARGFDPGMETYQVGWQLGRVLAVQPVCSGTCSGPSKLWSCRCCPTQRGVQRPAAHPAVPAAPAHGCRRPPLAPRLRSRLTRTASACSCSRPSRPGTARMWRCGAGRRGGGEGVVAVRHGMQRWACWLPRVS